MRCMAPDVLVARHRHAANRQTQNTFSFESPMGGGGNTQMIHVYGIRGQHGRRTRRIWPFLVGAELLRRQNATRKACLIAKWSLVRIAAFLQLKLIWNIKIYFGFVLCFCNAMCKWSQVKHRNGRFFFSRRTRAVCPVKCVPDAICCICVKDSRLAEFIESEKIEWKDSETRREQKRTRNERKRMEISSQEVVWTAK